MPVLAPRNNQSVSSNNRTPELKMDMIVSTQWQRQGVNGIGFTLYGLTHEGIMYRYDNRQDGWVRCGMYEVAATHDRNDRDS